MSTKASEALTRKPRVEKCDDGGVVDISMCVSIAPLN